MGSPLGPVIADIFVGWCESRIPDEAWPHMYCRFVDDAFSHCEDREGCDDFLLILNFLHPSLQFTCEQEADGRLPYLDIMVEKGTDDNILTSIYRKPTFTGLYITWDSFCATKYKTNTVRNFVQRAHRICSDSKLDEELAQLKSIFAKNGYPMDLLTRLVRQPTQCDVLFGPKRCPVYLKLLWKGPWSLSMSRAIASAAQSAYYAVLVNCVFTTSRAFNLKKDILPSHHQSYLTYKFECRNCVSTSAEWPRGWEFGNWEFGPHVVFTHPTACAATSPARRFGCMRIDRPEGDLERVLKRRIWFQKSPSLLKKRCLKQMRRIPPPKERFP